jgi:hypothetical protein
MKTKFKACLIRPPQARDRQFAANIIAAVLADYNWA